MSSPPRMFRSVDFPLRTAPAGPGNPDLEVHAHPAERVHLDLAHLVDLGYVPHAHGEGAVRFAAVSVHFRLRVNTVRSLPGSDNSVRRSAGLRPASRPARAAKPPMSDGPGAQRLGTPVSRPARAVLRTAHVATPSGQGAPPRRSVPERRWPERPGPPVFRPARAVLRTAHVATPPGHGGSHLGVQLQSGGGPNGLERGFSRHAARRAASAQGHFAVRRADAAPPPARRRGW